MVHPFQALIENGLKLAAFIVWLGIVVRLINGFIPP
jgi:hypothetical protein